MLNAKRARQLFAVHRWTGLLSGLVILFLSITGSLLVFADEIDRALNRDLLVTQPRGPMIPPEAALAAARQARPEAEVTAIHLPRDPRSTYVLVTRRVQGAEPYNQLMVDPYTAEVLGTRDYSASFVFVLRQLHLRFFAFGWQGRVVVGAFGLVLLVSIVAGLLIYGRFIRALPRWWSIRRGRGLQIAASDLHKLVGIVALAFNIVIAFTGAVLGLENLARYSPRVSHALHPRPATGMLGEPPATLAGAIPVTAAIERARAAIPGFEPVFVSLPRAGRSHYAVSGNLAGRIEMDRASDVRIHALTGEVLYRHSAREARAITRAYYWMDPLHFGYWGGVASKIFYVLLGLTTGFLSVTGFMVWYLKQRRRPRRTIAAAGARQTA